MSHKDLRAERVEDKNDNKIQSFRVEDDKESSDEDTSETDNIHAVVSSNIYNPKLSFSDSF